MQEKLVKYFLGQFFLTVGKNNFGNKIPLPGQGSFCRKWIFDRHFFAFPLPVLFSAIGCRPNTYDIIS